MERNRTKKDTKKRAKLETRALRKVGGNRSRTSFSFDHRRIRPAICYRTIRATIFFPSSFLLDDPRAAILFIPAYPFDGTRNFYLSSWSFPTFLERFILGFSFLRNRNTWDIIIAIQENDTGIISQRNCFERIEKNRTRLFVDSLSTSFRYSFSIDVPIDSFIENSINSNCSIIKY